MRAAEQVVDPLPAAGIIVGVGVVTLRIVEDRVGNTCKMQVLCCAYGITRHVRCRVHATAQTDSGDVLARRADSDACRLQRRERVLAYIHPRARTHLHVDGITGCLVQVLDIQRRTRRAGVAVVAYIYGILAFGRHDGFRHGLAVLLAHSRAVDDHHGGLRIALARLDNRCTGVLEHRHEVGHCVGGCEQVFDRGP